jgi:hypothetical protein
MGEHEQQPEQSADDAVESGALDDERDGEDDLLDPPSLPGPDG